MSTTYAAAMTYMIASTLGTPGIIFWGCLWAVLVYRHASSPHKEKDQSA